MASQQIISPVEIKQGPANNLIISWQDGHESAFSSFYLRTHCHCAVCVDEWTGRSNINPGAIDELVHPLQIEGIGRYGLRIQWSDGHNTGIYTFQFLRQICPCCQQTSSLK